MRYIKAKRAAGSGNEETTHWIATLQYAYADPSADPKMRGWNPLGFKVVDFRPEPEVIAEAHRPALAASAEHRSPEALRRSLMRTSCCSLLPRLLAFPPWRETGARTGTLGSADSHRAVQRRMRSTGCRFVGYQTDLEFEPGETFVGSRRRRYRRDLLRRPGQSSLPETQGGEGRDQSHHPHVPAHAIRSTTPPARSTGCDSRR